ncbi:ribonuclease ZC3H12A-like protein [Lates japonicus]|uniref:Ribonuclease ZC3H12A-like protein n=1 Tax=Lates japonicus TaxID=270547 RepID=A0AAD3NHM4_LATJO|nr:ribonuclease ZC3H12A-like protein [Lates japonicus]
MLLFSNHYDRNGRVKPQWYCTSHGNKEVFSCLGIQLAVNFFLDRGHTEVNVFVPSWRKEQPRPDVPITDQHILRGPGERKILVIQSRGMLAGKRVVCNDDCFIAAGFTVRRHHRVQRHTDLQRCTRVGASSRRGLLMYLRCHREFCPGMASLAAFTLVYAFPMILWPLWTGP